MSRPAQAIGPAVALLWSAALASMPAAAQDPVTSTYAVKPAAVVGSRLVNSATPYTVGARRFELWFAHRFRGAVQDGSGHDLWGLDAGADVTIGAAYGVTSSWDVSLSRTSLQEDFEAAVKWRGARQAAGAPLNLAVRAGVDHLARPGVADATRPFLQIAMSRQLSARLEVFATPTWVGDTPRLRNAFNVPVGASVLVKPGYRVEGEYVPANRELPTSVAAWHIALSRTLGGHLFKVTVGNSRAMTVDQIVGSDSIASFDASDVRLGFNLIRYLPH